MTGLLCYTGDVRRLDFMDFDDPARILGEEDRRPSKRLIVASSPLMRAG